MAKSPTPEQMQASDPSVSAWVAANAGSGKTHVLVDRVIRLMLDDAAPETILCLTFTKAAAAEMQSRLFQRLGGWALASDDDLADSLEALGADGTMLVKARRLFTRAMETPGGLKILTLHGFAEKILKLFPVEAGVAPDFEVLDERESARLLDRAFKSVLDRAFDGDATVSELKRSLTLVEEHAGEAGFEPLVSQVLNKRAFLSYLVAQDLDLTTLNGLYRKALSLDVDAGPDFAKADVLAIDRQAYISMAAVLAPLGDHHKRNCGLLLRAIAAETEEDKIYAQLRNLVFTAKQEPRSRDRFLSKVHIKAYPQQADWLFAEIDRIENAVLRYDLAVRAEASAALVFFALSVYQNVSEAKRARGAQDFDDLIGIAARLVSSRASAAWVLRKLDKGINHILVDEAQDTSPAQWLIVKALTEEFFAGQGASEVNRTLFVVGDRKQSIYSFQGADAQSFVDSHALLSGQILTAQKQFADVDLKLSFRSVPVVLDLVDAVFSPRDIAVLGFADDGSDYGHSAMRLGQTGAVHVWPLVRTLKTGKPDDADAPVDAAEEGHHTIRLAQLIARTLRSWIGHRIIAATGKAVTPGDIMILFRSRGRLFRHVIAELRKRGVPVAGVDRLRLRQSLAVMDLAALVQFLLLPDDDHALACLLKSPLVPHAMHDEQLFDLTRVTIPGEEAPSLWRKLGFARDDVAHANSSFVDHLFTLKDKLGPFEFFAQVLAASRKRIARRMGPEAEDATAAFLDMAMDYQIRFQPSLSGFIAWFLADESDIKREMEQQSGLVRLLTVHGSKGLEAPIVILADAAVGKSGKGASPLVHAPRGHGFEGLPVMRLGGLTPAALLESWEAEAKRLEDAEHKRMLYVAMTRARDELHICGSSARETAEPESWYGFIMKQLAEPDARLGLASELIMDGCDGAGLAFGALPVVEQRTVADPGIAPDLPDWVLRPYAGGTVWTEEQARDAGTMADALAALATGHAELAALLQADDAEWDVNFGYLDDDGKAATGHLERLVVRPDMVALLVLPSQRRTAIGEARFKCLMAAMARHFSGRRIVAALYWQPENTVQVIDSQTPSRDGEALYSGNGGAAA